MNTQTGEFLKYVNTCTSPFGVVRESAEYLKANGYRELDAATPWKLSKGDAYYTKVYGSSIFAFVIGSEVKEGAAFHIAGAHTDFPCFRVKPNAEMCDNGYLKLDVECYGGAILNTWLDRPLSIAGRVSIKGKSIYEPELIDIDFKRPLLTIPNLAIHFNRDVNKGVELNKQTELLPIIGMLKDELDKDSFFVSMLADKVGEVVNREISIADILDFDLYIYNAEEGCLLGRDNEFISAPRLDDISSCFACIRGIKESSDRINLAALYDNEEIGSRSKQGADSDLLRIIMEKIYAGLGFNISSLNSAVFKSMALSVDVAHAYHPNYGSKYDPNNKAIAGNGVALKLNYSQKYATDTEAVAILQCVCDENDIKYQKYVNRSDIAGGGTIGSIISAHIPMRTVDIGVPVLAMHSARELMAEADLQYLCRLIEAFWK